MMIEKDNVEMVEKLPRLLLMVGWVLLTSRLITQAETLPPLKDGKSPQTLDEVWAGVDPNTEPLESEICKEWEEDGVILRAVRYCVGTFKGQNSWMAGYYGFPKGGKNLPGIVQIHGGGGYGKKEPCIQNAKRGYATISLSWRGDERYLKEGDLPESAQTDWGAVEGRQVRESRGIEPNNEKRYDPVPSGRNEGYFLRTLAARRALTFLEQQPEVDGSKLGVDGHSMGGVITLETAAMDSRVKAAAPSCAPPLDLEDSLVARTSAPSAYATKIHCPLLFMSPANDFHGRVEDMEWIMDRMPNQDFRIARSEHLNHKHNNSCLAAKQLWFDARLKNSFSYPDQPEISVDLKARDGRPLIKITPDSSMPIDCVDIFYSRDAKYEKYGENKTRFWQYARPVKQGDNYCVSLDLFDLQEPLWVFANIHYKLEQSAAGDSLTHASDTFTVTTRMIMKSSEQLQQAGIKADGQKSSVIESFGPDWEKEWVVDGSKMESWRLNDARVPMPEYGKLVIELQCDAANKLSVEIGGNRGNFLIKGGATTERIEVYPFDLQHKETKSRLLNWPALVRPSLSLVSDRGKALPLFKKIYWEEIPEKEFMDKRPSQLGGGR